MSMKLVIVLMTLVVSAIIIVGLVTGNTDALTSLNTTMASGGGINQSVQ